MVKLTKVALSLVLAAFMVVAVSSSVSAASTADPMACWNNCDVITTK